MIIMIIIDANGSYGQVKLAIQKQSAEKVSSYEAEYFSLANIHNSPDMITIAAITAITAIAKSRKIFTTPSKQQLITFKERHRLQPQRSQESPLIPSLQPPLVSLFIPQPIPASLVEKVPELNKFAVIDAEWYRDDFTENRQKGIAGNIYAFCLVSSGRELRLHVDDFMDRHAFMSAILDVMEQYQYGTLAGYAILNSKKNGREFISDLGHILNNCEQEGLREKLSNIGTKVQVLDTYKIFTNNAVKGFLKAAAAVDVDFRGEGLDDVSRSYIGKGKLEGISGINAETLTSDEQLEYCLQDTRLCYELLQKNDFEILYIMYQISQEVRLSFFETCNAGFPTTWWEAKLKSVSYQKPLHIQQWIDDNMTYNKNGKKTGVKYLGGYVAKPKPGGHLGAVSYDVSSMYPTMIYVHNLSTETVNCECCRDDLNAQVPNEVMNEINGYLTGEKSKARKKENRPWHYWICRRKRGKLSEIMEYLIRRKREYKELKEKLKEKAIKILMNSGYGCFGFPYFFIRTQELRN
jgi:DNA polymerase family B